MPGPLFAKAVHISQAKIGPGVHFLPRTNYRVTAHPVRVVTGLNCPYGIAVNSHGEMIVSECWGKELPVFDIRGQRIRTLGSRGYSPEQMVLPAGIALMIWTMFM